MPQPRSSLNSQLSEQKSRASAAQISRAAEIVAEDVVRRRSQEIADDVASKMGAAYQASLEKLVKSIMTEVADGMDKLQTAVSGLSGPQVDTAAFEAAVSNLRTDFQNIEFPAPEVVTPSPTAAPSDASGGRDYELDVQRDGQGFISGVTARAIDGS